jgi:hypothetical protein
METNVIEKMILNGHQEIGTVNRNSRFDLENIIYRLKRQK